MYNITSVIGIQGIFLKPRKCTRVCQLDVLLTGDGGVGGGENHRPPIWKMWSSSRRAQGKQPQSHGNLGEGSTIESKGEELQAWDVTGSVQYFREGQSDQDRRAPSGFSNKGDID